MGIIPPALLPVALRLWSTLRRAVPEWEYVPQGWSSASTNRNLRGWNVTQVLEAYEAKWPAFVRSVGSNAPFGTPPDAAPGSGVDLIFHNAIMSYAYALALAARHKASISMLDWGGGIGHYYLISKALLPDVQFEYHCKDVPVLAAHGAKLFPEARFYVDERCLARRYDFVLASTSLHYSEHWQATLNGLAGSTAGYLFVTQLPIVYRAPSFVMLQRAYKYGYDTEYLGWCLNRNQFLDAAAAANLSLVREFIIGYRPAIHNAPEQCIYAGFLFRPADAGSRQ